MKKTLKILTASFCFLVLMWSLSFAEKVSAAIEIDDVQINGFVTPIVGSKPYPKESFKIVSSNPHYKISSVKWMEPVDGSPHEMTTPAFREGVKYIVDIILEADTGYVFKNKREILDGKANRRHRIKQRLIDILPQNVKALIKRTIPGVSVSEKYKEQTLEIMKKMNLTWEG